MVPPHLLELLELPLSPHLLEPSLYHCAQQLLSACADDGVAKQERRLALRTHAHERRRPIAVP